MESILPKPEDHCRVQILVKNIGQIPNVLLEKLIKRVEAKLDKVQVISQNVQRVILPRIITEANADLIRFTEIQAFRKVFGLICIAQCKGEQMNSCASSPDLTLDQTEENCIRLRRTSLVQMPSIDTQEETTSESKQMALLKDQYQKVKKQYNDQLVDSRCVIFGHNSSNQNSTEILTFPCLDDINLLSEHLETIMRDLLRSIYVVLDSKRLDTSFEKMESPQCPLLPDEEKYRMGLENVKSKNYRKKCIGRLKKKLADYTLLTGYFEAALQSYQSAIDLLKATSDLLWLAAAYEGWCCAAMMLKYTQHMPKPPNSNRNLTVKNTQNNGETKILHGHHRYRSDEVAKIVGTTECSYMPDSSDIEVSPSSSGDTSPQTELPKIITQPDMSKNQNHSSISRSVNEQQGKKWRNLLNFETSSSIQSLEDKQNMVMHFENLPVPTASGMSACSRSASAQNLISLSGAANSNTTGKLSSITAQNQQQKNGPMKANASKNATFSRTELAERFRQSLENYGRFSFAIHMEYECMMRAVHLPIIYHQYIEVESFLREHTCRFLDDKFVTFNNTMKSNICLATAEVYKQVGFKRKFAFFLRLAVFFRLYNETHSENDYRKVYPYLNESLAGYGIGRKQITKRKTRGKIPGDQLQQTLGSSSTYSLQIKAVHEVFTVAMRAGLLEIATRHLCFMLETFYDHLDKAASLALVEELNKLNQQGNGDIHELGKPMFLDSYPPVFLPSLQFTRFPALKQFSILPLSDHLAPRIIDKTSFQSKIFIYSPFQERLKKEEICWVLNCASGVSVRTENPLPIELSVNNLTLLTEGCEFEAIPIRLNLPSCYGPCIDSSRNEIKLLGIPRSTGTLRIIGYSCEVLGCRNVMKFSLHDGEEQSKRHIVRILPHLPLLQLETSLKRYPTLSENPNDALVEVCVFSGQSLTHPLVLFNSSESIGIRRITIKIEQPKVSAGQKLLEITNDKISSNKSEFDCQVFDLKAGERRKIDIHIFGIDPATATPLENNFEQQKTIDSTFGEEQKVYVRRPTSTSLTTIVTDSGFLGEPSKCEDSVRKAKWTPTKHSEPSVSTPLLEDDTDSAYHDLIPYTGRLLSAEFAITYTADLPSDKEEEYMRFTKFPLAITIVPAVNVSNWHILAGDSPFTRYIVVDVFNQTDSEAELSYGQEKRKITVQPKEICRVPLLCSCCTTIKSIAFQKATQRASHMMQMQEVDRLRRAVEKHVVKHLDIYWTIPRLKLNGQVPVGSLLSSVTFLRQLVLPSLTINMHVNQQTNVAVGDINVRVGELITIEVSLFYSISGNLSGLLSLKCHQDLQNNNQQPVESSDNLIFCGQNKIPFRIEQSASFEERSLNFEEDDEEITHQTVPSIDAGQFKAMFNVVFCYEGVHKISPKFEDLEVRNMDAFYSGQITTLNDEDIFMPALSFNVIN